MERNNLFPLTKKASLIVKVFINKYKYSFPLDIFTKILLGFPIFKYHIIMYYRLI